MPSSARSSGSVRSSHRSSRSSSRSFHHGHHRHRRRHRFHLKQSERNLVAAIFDMVVMAVLISALADQSWFKLHGGQCEEEYLGIYKFLIGGTTPVHCYTSQTVALIRAVICFIFLSLCCTLFAFFLDTLGPSKSSLKFVRRHAVGNILTVLLIVMICGLCYWAADDIQKQLHTHPKAVTSKTLVTFDSGYFLMVISGTLSVLIAASNLLWPHPLQETVRRRRLIDDWEDFLESDIGSVAPSFNNLPPPPEYAP